MTRRLQQGAPVRVGELEIVPVEATYVRAEALGGGLAAMASKEPVAVIVRVGGRVRAFDLEGRELPAGELRRLLDAPPP